MNLDLRGVVVTDDDDDPLDWIGSPHFLANSFCRTDPSDKKSASHAAGGGPKDKDPVEQNVVVVKANVANAPHAAAKK